MHIDINVIFLVSNLESNSLPNRSEVYRAIALLFLSKNITFVATCIRLPICVAEEILCSIQTDVDFQFPSIISTNAVVVVAFGCGAAAAG